MKKLLKILKNVIFLLIVLMVVCIITITIARIFYAKQIKITGENGIEDSLYLDIGGIEQYLQIRGENKDNPIILVLHGGPGSPMSYYSYYWQTDLEEDFTVVQWDQRGCGRTYYANEMQGMKNPTTELLLSDLDEIVTYLTNRFNQKNVIILGHSWGTVLGARYTQLYPEKVSTYISVGQTVDSIKGDLLSVEQAVLLAKNAEDETTANDIIKAYEDFISGSLDMKELITLRTLTSRYLPSGENMSGLQQIWMGVTSPQMGMDDLRWYLYAMIDFDGFSNVNRTLFNQLFENDGINFYDYPNEYQVPVYFVSGDSDWITPYIMVEDYYETIVAPKKKMILIKNAGHSPFLDKKVDFYKALKEILLP